jgi:uncharacterized surface protein with fasciclin (FAS1) repeats
MKLSIKHIFFSVAVVSATMSCKKEDKVQAYPTFEEFMKTQSDLSTYAAAFEKAQLNDFKSGPGPFTYLAPTNTAFTNAGITADSLNKMTAGQVSYILMYHMLASSNNPPTPVTTLDMNAPVSVSRSTQLPGVTAFNGTNSGKFFVNGAELVGADNWISNGVIHKINRVNVPPALRGNIQTILGATGRHSLFIALLTRAGQWAQLTGGTFTVLAPNDAAMTAAGAPFNNLTTINAMPVADAARFARYHMFSGARLFSNDFKDGLSPATLQGPGRTIAISQKGTKLRGPLNSGDVDFGSFRDFLGTNGVVQEIAGLLRPNP